MRNIYFIILIITLCIHNLSAKLDNITYKSIRSIVLEYKRPITILDFGAGDGKHSFKLAQEFPKSVYVMIDNNDTLLAKCYKKALSNIIYLNKRLDIKELLLLSECEHFDIIILGNVLHEFGQKWTDAFRAFRTMGDHLIIENPPRELNTPIISNRTRRTIGRFLDKHTIPILGMIHHKNTVEKTKIYHINTGKFHSIQRKIYPWKEKLPHNSHIIDSSYTHKKLTKHVNGNTILRSWVPGINFFTFKMLNGQYPTKETLKTTLISKNKEYSGTLTVNNMIIQGSNITIINRSKYDSPLECPGAHSFFFDKHIEEIIHMINIDDQKKIGALCNFK